MRSRIGWSSSSRVSRCCRNAGAGVVLLLCAADAACGPRAPEEPPPLGPDGVTAVADFPAGAPCTRARIVREYIHASSAAAGGGHGMWGGGSSYSPPRRTQTLELACGDERPRTIRLEEHRLDGPDPAPPGASLSIAPDSHALVASVDGGATWKYVALDMPGNPAQYLGHAAFDAAAGGWSRLPDTSAHVVARLRLLAEDPEGGIAEERRGLMLDPLLTYVCQRPDDEVLATVVTAAFTESVSPILVAAPGHRPGDPCLWRVVERHPAARRQLHPLLGDLTHRDHDRRAMAAWVLAGSADEEDQRAIARALAIPATAPADPAREGYVRVFLSWALAASTARRGAAPDEVVERLAALATEPDPWPYAAWDAVHVNAVRGLAAVPTHPVAARALAALATGCTPNAAPGLAPPLSLPASFVRPDEAHLDVSTYPLPCWAEAARR